jgi:hypothetical protein
MYENANTRISQVSYLMSSYHSNNRWARCAYRGHDRKTILKVEELLDFLSLTKSTFGPFQAELLLTL